MAIRTKKKQTAKFARENTSLATLYGLTSFSFLFIGFLFALFFRWKLTHYSGMEPAIQNEFSQLGIYHGVIMIYLGMIPLGLGFFGNFESRHIHSLRLISHFSYCCVLIGGLGFCVMLATSLIDIELVFHGFEQRKFALYSLLIVLLGLMLLAVVIIADTAKMMMDYFGSKNFHPYVFACQLASALLFLTIFLQLAPHVIGILIARYTATGSTEFDWSSLFTFLGGASGYVLLLPAMGVISVVLSEHTKRELKFARLFVLAVSFLVVIGFFEFFFRYLDTSWPLLKKLEQIALALPPVVLFLAIVRNLRYPLKYKSAGLYFCIMSIPMFALGAISGIALLIPSINQLVAGTSYATAHIHYLLAPGALFTLIGGAYHYYPKIRGVSLDPVYGKLHFWLSIIAVNSIFLPMLFQGLSPLSDLRYLMFCGSIALFLAQLVFIFNLFVSERARSQKQR